MSLSVYSGSPCSILSAPITLAKPTSITEPSATLSPIRNPTRSTRPIASAAIGITGTMRPGRSRGRKPAYSRRPITYRRKG